MLSSAFVFARLSVCVWQWMQYKMEICLGFFYIYSGDQTLSWYNDKQTTSWFELQIIEDSGVFNRSTV